MFQKVRGGKSLCHQLVTLFSVVFSLPHSGMIMMFKIQHVFNLYTTVYSFFYDLQIAGEYGTTVNSAGYCEESELEDEVKYD